MFCTKKKNSILSPWRVHYFNTPIPPQLSVNYILASYVLLELWTVRPSFPLANFSMTNHTYVLTLSIFLSEPKPLNTPVSKIQILLTLSANDIHVQRLLMLSSAAVPIAPSGHLGHLFLGCWTSYVPGLHGLQIPFQPFLIEVLL